MSKYDENQIWKYFDGELRGVKDRVCKGVAKSLEGNAAEDDSDLEKLIGLPGGVLRKIRGGDQLNGEFTAHAVQRLAGCCRLDLGECFRVKALSEAEKADIIRAANDEGFIALAATGDPEWSEDDRIELFLMTTALRQLDNSENS